MRLFCSGHCWLIVSMFYEMWWLCVLELGWSIPKKWAWGIFVVLCPLTLVVNYIRKTEFLSYIHFGYNFLRRNFSIYSHKKWRELFVSRWRILAGIKANVEFLRPRNWDGSKKTRQQHIIITTNTDTIYSVFCSNEGCEQKQPKVAMALVKFMALKKCNFKDCTNFAQGKGLYTRHGYTKPRCK